VAQLLVVGQRQNLLYPLGTDSYNGKTTGKLVFSLSSIAVVFLQ
jgi:hypothetical protein